MSSIIALIVTVISADADRFKEAFASALNEGQGFAMPARDCIEFFMSQFDKSSTGTRIYGSFDGVGAGRGCPGDARDLDIYARSVGFLWEAQEDLVVEGKKVTAGIGEFVLKVFIKEGNIVATVCAVLGYFAVVMNHKESLGVANFEEKYRPFSGFVWIKNEVVGFYDSNMVFVTPWIPVLTIFSLHWWFLLSTTQFEAKREKDKASRERKFARREERLA